MKTLILLAAFIFVGCSTDSVNSGCPTIMSYTTYGQSNAQYAHLNFSDGSSTDLPLAVVEKKVGDTNLIGKTFCK